jgi:hypothetical protein
MIAKRTTGKWVFHLLPIAVVVAVIAFAVRSRLMPDHPTPRSIPGLQSVCICVVSLRAQRYEHEIASERVPE